MSQLCVLSFDCSASPSLSIARNIKLAEKSEIFYGWGVAWYPHSNGAAVVIKDSAKESEKRMTRAIQKWQEFQSTSFLCHIRGASKGLSQQDMQPFRRTYAGRDWLLSHIGEIYDSDYLKTLTLGKNPVFEPVRKIDSEHIFCWLLSEINKKKARKLSQFGFGNMYTLLQKVNQLGNVNLVMLDGEDLIVYQDKNHFSPFYYTRIKPPYSKNVLKLGDAVLEVGDHLDAYRTLMIVSTERSNSYEWKKMDGAQMMVLRRGQVIWDSSISGKKIKNQMVEPRKIERQSIEILSIYHKTTYRYDSVVELSKHFLRLHPMHDEFQKVLANDITISVEHKQESFKDVFGNKVTFIKPNAPFETLIIEMYSKVAIKDSFQESVGMLNRRGNIPLVWMPWQRQMMSAYLLPPELPESQLLELYDFSMSFVERNDYDVMEVLLDLNKTIYKDFTYESGVTNVNTTPFEVYIKRKGVCQDFANLFICISRILSIPARYRTGYIYTGINHENKMQSDASHAWVEVYFPWQGWVGYDPTNGCLANQDYVRVACGRNFYDATPTSGTIYKGGEENETLDIEVKVSKE